MKYQVSIVEVAHHFLSNVAAEQQVMPVTLTKAWTLSTVTYAVCGHISLASEMHVRARDEEGCQSILNAIAVLGASSDPASQCAEVHGLA